MYLKNIALKNIGPLESVNIELPFNERGNPKPLLIVGENGSGKTILMSQIIDSLYEVASEIFDDVAKQNGLKRSYYKISGHLNITSGKDEGFVLTRYISEDNISIEYMDKVGPIKEDELKRTIEDFSLKPNNTEINQKQCTRLNHQNKEKLTKDLIENVHFFQPAYRYEEPFWKNENFKDETRFEEQKKFSGNLGKELEIITSNKINKSYLLDLVLDYVAKLRSESDKVLWNNINEVLREIKKKKNIRFGIGPRGSYRVSIVELNDDGSIKRQYLPSIDALSLGESTLLNLFINIIRHGDAIPKKIEDISGIVAIDEIDVHLHTDLQYNVLPKLIKKFPKIQFIISTHSPLFILGMRKNFGEEGYEIISLPDGNKITSERFSEFERAYNVLKDTEKFDDEIKKEIQKSKKPIVFVEGEYDIKYIRKAAELLENTELIDNVNFINADGYRNLNNIWNHKSNLFEAIPNKMLLLYDCDTKVQEGQKGKIFKKIIPYIKENLFDRGIENLFPKETIMKARDHKKAFVDYTPEIKKEIRGIEVVENEKYSINPDEKGNLCDWICDNGTKEDFKNFDRVFDIIKSFLSDE